MSPALLLTTAGWELHSLDIRYERFLMEHHDIKLLLSSRAPILILETHEETRAVELLTKVAITMGHSIFKWSVAKGLQRIDLAMEPQTFLKEPVKVVEHIASSDLEAIYVLLDFHPYLQDPAIVRHLKELGQTMRFRKSRVVLISHNLEVPVEIKKLAADYKLALPDAKALHDIVIEEANAYTRQNPGQRVSTAQNVLDQLINNLKGLTHNDARRLAHGAIFDDGAITESDLPDVMEAKYKLLTNDSLLAFEFETSSFSELAGMKGLKKWLHQREKFFHQKVDMPGMDPPKGILLLGVQGCGKSVAAKAVAGVWKVPLLRLDFGRLYNKYIGESEGNIRDALKMAEVMSPCVLWMDELEKGISVSENDDGTSQRILGTLLTWMAENKSPVFIVATSNDIQQLPPELIRKGRLDEVSFVDLPNTDVRQEIFRIHAEKRGLDMAALDLPVLADLTDGFSGSEIEQLVVSAIYAAHAKNSGVKMSLLTDEIKNTRPLSVLMAEKIAALREWAAGRTVPVD